MLRIANAAGCLGDRTDAARTMVDQLEVDYLTLEYLSECTMPILAELREKDRTLGYADEFLDVLRLVSPALFLQSQLHIVTDAGGVNPRACAEAAGGRLVENGSPNVGIGVVRGDDLLDRLEELTAAGYALENLDNGESFHDLKKPVVAANAHIGAQPIVQALEDGARIVVTGRVAEASLTVGPTMHQFGWAWNDWDKLASATVAGHLIECGTQVTGGYSTQWNSLDLTDIGHPIAEINQQGRTWITKPPGTGGAVTRQVVVEQLLFGIGDPAHFGTPDVDADFSKVEVIEVGRNKIDVQGAIGNAPSTDVEVAIVYHAGFSATAELLVWGPDCVEKAQAVADIVSARAESAGQHLDVVHVELLGTGAGVPGWPERGRQRPSPAEVVLRMTVQSDRRDRVERFAREITPLFTSGPAGLVCDAVGRPLVQPIFAEWPTRLPKDVIEPVVEVRPAKEWI